MSAKSSKNGVGGGGASLDGWVVMLFGVNSILGRIVGGEASVRAEMKAGKIPMATLDPAILCESQMILLDQGSGRLTPTRAKLNERFEQALDLGKRARLPLQVALISFAFLSDLDDDDARDHVLRKIHEVEQSARALNAGLVIPGAR